MDLDTARIRCPRCNEAMDIYSREANGGPVLADMCLTCGGVWLDGAEVAKVYPAFADLGDRLAGAATADPQRHIVCCPRCGHEPVGFAFFDVALDHCPSCQGLWIDGDELSDLARTADRADGLPAPAPAGYRTNAARAVRGQRVPCNRCGEELPLAAAELTSQGPMCDRCAQAFRDEVLDKSREGYEPPKESLVDLPAMGDVLGASGRAVEIALTTPSRCSSCGCHGHTRCGH